MDELSDITGALADSRRGGGDVGRAPRLGAGQPDERGRWSGGAAVVRMRLDVRSSDWMCWWRCWRGRARLLKFLPHDQSRLSSQVVSRQAFDKKVRNFRLFKDFRARGRYFITPQRSPLAKDGPGRKKYSGPSPKRRRSAVKFDHDQQSARAGMFKTCRAACSTAVTGASVSAAPVPDGTRAMQRLPRAPHTASPASQPIRRDLVASIRHQIATGCYLTELKLSIAADRMIDGPRTR
jgi:hypothetical protein